MKKTKLIIPFTLFMLLSFITTADMNISFDVSTEGNIDFYSNLFTSNGDVSVYFDGYGYNNTHSNGSLYITELQRPEYYNCGTDSTSMKYSIADTFAEYDFDKRTNKETITIQPYSKLDRASLLLRRVMEFFFVTREEYKEIIRHQQNQIAQLQLDVLALQTLVKNDDLCKAKMRIADQHGINEFKCSGKNYYYDENTDSFITLTKK